MTKRKFKVPHTLVILFSMVVLAQILTYTSIPAGSFDRVETEVGANAGGSGQLPSDSGHAGGFAVRSLTAIPKGFQRRTRDHFFRFHHRRTVCGSPGNGIA